MLMDVFWLENKCSFHLTVIQFLKLCLSPINWWGLKPPQLFNLHLKRNAEVKPVVSAQKGAIRHPCMASWRVPIDPVVISNSLPNLEGFFNKMRKCI